MNAKARPRWMSRRLLRLGAVALLSLCGITLAWAQGKPVSGAAASSGSALFNQECAGCHGEDGHGVIAMPSMPDLRDPALQKQWSDAELAGVIVNGKGLMPTFKEALSPEQVQNLVKYVRGLPALPALPRPERTSCATCHGRVQPGAVVPNGETVGRNKVAPWPKPQTLP